MCAYIGKRTSFFFFTFTVEVIPTNSLWQLKPQHKGNMAWMTLGAASWLAYTLGWIKKQKKKNECRISLGRITQLHFILLADRSCTGPAAN